MYKMLLAAITLTVSTSLSHAALMSPLYEGCLRDNGSTSDGIQMCINNETKFHDEHLNEIYKQLVKDVSSERKKQLQSAQRAWIKYRDTNCAFYNNPDHGTFGFIAQQTCIMNMTAERAQELEDLILEQP